MSRLWTEEQFNCPVCLDLPFEPVTIPCGHSYCMECITDFWDSERKKTGSCSCPECRQNFDPRPRLCRNTMLAEAVEQLRVGNLSSKARESIRDARRAAAAASERSARDGGGRVPAGRQLPASSAPCGRCVEPRAAVKTCLTCMASFCEVHLKPHETQPKLKSHELIAPTADLTQKICPEHKYLQEFYCRSCQTYICWLCTSNQHKEHESVSTQAERAEKQKTLLAVQTENLQKLQDRERELKDMKKVLETLKVMSTSGQEKINESKQVVDKLEMEIRQLRKKDSDLKDLVTCQDNIYFLRTYQCLCSPELSELGSVTANLETSFDPVQNIISDLREKVENMCNQELEKINKLAERATNSPRPRASYNREEREQACVSSSFILFSSCLLSTEREIQSTARSQSRQNSSTNKEEADTSSVQSLRQSTQRRENQEQANGEVQGSQKVQDTAMTKQQPERQSNGEVQGSQKVQDTVMTKQQPERQLKQATPIQQEIESPQDQFNPGLFLDSPSSDSSFTPAFPNACDLTFDPNTAHRRLVLSEDDTKATLHTAAQSYPEVPERFDSWTQILSLQPISSTRCYWEVEWRGRGSSVGVASASMPRKGADAKAGLGYNKQSWSLELSDMFCAAMHANQKQEISVTYCPRVGVFLNQEEESLSFYGVDDVLMHLHTFHGVSSSQPLFAAFGVGSGVGVGLDFAMGNFSASTDSIKICSI
ncbi:E3 ubiquitin/ISG15 ligase TRIM25 isoform X1 [Silurus asotus]|uniref:E3 ubiquitin/ISG15 ligase TRIM25 isoform X1 n=1 Tax=Silurus asotus TaxID=30991 RepID=A0AAD5AE40_SILAS|nr:E3 ubiquitin/ISG15 ligase TRIM25 isoform X1 [Silurus asotus]